MVDDPGNNYRQSKENEGEIIAKKDNLKKSTGGGRGLEVARGNFETSLLSVRRMTKSSGTRLGIFWLTLSDSLCVQAGHLEVGPFSPRTPRAVGSCDVSVHSSLQPYGRTSGTLQERQVQAPVVWPHLITPQFERLQKPEILAQYLHRISRSEGSMSCVAEHGPTGAILASNLNLQLQG